MKTGEIVNTQKDILNQVKQFYARVGRFLTEMVKTYRLNQFKLSRQKQVFDAQMSKTSKNPKEYCQKLDNMS